MNILLLGAAGFIGTNLVIALDANKSNNITVIDNPRVYFSAVDNMHFSNVTFIESDLTMDTDFDYLIRACLAS